MGIDNNLETEGARDQEKIASAIIRDFTLVSSVSRSHGLNKRPHNSLSDSKKIAPKLELFNFLQIISKKFYYLCIAKLIIYVLT